MKNLIIIPIVFMFWSTSFSQVVDLTQLDPNDPMAM